MSPFYFVSPICGTGFALSNVLCVPFLECSTLLFHSFTFARLWLARSLCALLAKPNQTILAVLFDYNSVRFAAGMTWSGDWFVVAIERMAAALDFSHGKQRQYAALKLPCQMIWPQFAPESMWLLCRYRNKRIDQRS